MIEYTFDDGEFSMPDDIYAQILAPLGYPFISDDELEYPQEQIIRLAIVKGLREYFHWCPPVKCDGAKAVNGQVQCIAMPNDCYGVVGLSLQQKGGGMAGGGVFGYAAELALYSGMGTQMGFYGGTQAPMTNLNAQGSFFNNRATRQAMINYARRVHYEGPFNIGELAPNETLEGSPECDKFIRVYSNTQGEFNIWWAKKSLDWKDVEFAQHENVVKYCSACVKELFANLRRQGQVKGGFDYGVWLTEAKADKEAITADWKKLVKYSGIQRGSL